MRPIARREKCPCVRLLFWMETNLTCLLYIIYFAPLHKIEREHYKNWMPRTLYYLRGDLSFRCWRHKSVLHVEYNVIFLCALCEKVLRLYIFQSSAERESPFCPFHRNNHRVFYLRAHMHVYIINAVKICVFPSCMNFLPPHL